MSRKLVVPILVTLLAAAAIAAIVGLQQRASEGRTAQLQLSKLETSLAMLQNAPFRASRSTGGSPAIAGKLLRTGKAQISVTLNRLGRHDPPRSLVQLQVPLRANYSALDRIYAIGVATGTYGPKADRLSGTAGRTQGAATALLGDAGDEYAQRASRADLEATAGAATAIILLVWGFAFLYRQNRRLLDSSRQEALSDALTGLGNRRALVGDLEAGLARANVERPLLLALFDLDGFKQYNDTYGHPAGDALLARVGERLRETLGSAATAYRMGGDEFCVLASTSPETRGSLLTAAAAALSESSSTFSISCSYGSALMPAEASSPEEALQLADQRMYARKAGTATAGRQSSDVLLKVLSERSNSLQSHVSNVGELARTLSQAIGLSEREQERIQLGAELHDIGKTAIPDSVLNKPGELDAEEWEYVHRHPMIGERIILAAPSLAETAALVRSSHERIDGRGYPDGLAGDEIPIGARIIAICDAYDAMISDRPYRAAISPADALAELRRHAGTQFDQNLVDAFLRIEPPNLLFDLDAAHVLAASAAA